MFKRDALFVNNLLIKNKKKSCGIVLMSRYWNHQERRTLTALQENRKWIGRVLGQTKDHRSSLNDTKATERKLASWVFTRARETKRAKATENITKARRGIGKFELFYGVAQTEQWTWIETPRLQKQGTETWSVNLHKTWCFCTATAKQEFGNGSHSQEWSSVFAFIPFLLKRCKVEKLKCSVPAL